MGLIAELWLTGRVPAWDGLYRVDGTALDVHIDGSEGVFARLDSDGGLLWVVALRESNPPRASPRSKGGGRPGVRGVPALV